MPLNTDLNVAPYFDDYDELKNYHRILFRPGTAVQAREMTQLQSILQNQIERFGGWAFKNGDIVTGCSVYDMPVVPYVRVMDFASNGSANTSPLNVVDYVNAIATSATSGLKAKVLYANTGFSTNYPDNNIFYLNYLNTGSGGEQQFSNAELLNFVMVTPEGNVALTNVYTWANTSTDTFTSGNAHGVSVTEGVIFINGNFVRVSNSTFGLVNNFGTYAGNNVIGFMLNETIITENQDESLLDNALGYSNENAPGAHRMKLTPYIVSLTPDQASSTKDFNPIGTYNYGAFVTKTVVGANLYSVVGDVVAKRTYEESGDYVVNPFIVDTITQIGSNTALIAAENANSVLGRISPGIGYAQGKRVEILKTSYINLRRGIDTATSLSQAISFNYGSYFLLNEVAGSFVFNKAQTVTLYDSAQKAVSTRSFSSINPTGNAIGTAMMRCFSLSAGNPGSASAQYYLHVFNISMNPGYNTSQIKSVYYNGTNKGVADVISKGLVNASQKGQLYSFGVSGLKNLRDQANNVKTEYVYRTTASGTMLTTGNVTITITSSAPGGTDQLPYGIGIQTDGVGSTFSLVAQANVDTAALTGTVAVSSTNTTVTGTSTTFTTNFLSGDLIKVGSSIRTINTIANATSLTVDAPFGSTLSGQTYYKSYLKGKLIPFSRTIAGPNGYVYINNTTSFTIVSGQYPSSSMPVDVVYDIKRKTTTPAGKTIKKDRFVRINTSTNPKGPWCLGFSDIHKVTAVYGTSNGTYTTAGFDLTSNFTFDTGQKDTHYDLGYLYPKSSYSAASYPNLLVQLDYFAVNTAPGIGFFTVESYPIDDANTANTNAIQTKDIPLYISESGAKITLRDFVDFRTPSTPTANDTGAVDTSSSSQVTTAISYSTLNPSSTLTLNIPTSGLNFPSYGQTFEADFTRYLPRRDLIMITPDNVLKVKEGVSSDNPQTPLFPENAMPLAVLNIPPYPSLSTDQVDQFLPINQRAKTLVRDASLSISGSLVTNRRYTMKDIGTLDQRITNLEYYTALSLLEKKAKDLTVTDGNGLDRFKNGIFVDPFNDFSLGDVSNQEYSIAIDSTKGVARPKIIREVFNVKFNEGTKYNTVKTGRLVSLAYLEMPFLIQPYATKYRNSALVAFAWNGKAFLVPAYDNHQDLHNTGSINITIDNSTPWKDFAASPFGTIWGDWRTTSTTTTNTVISGTVGTYTSTVTLKTVGGITLQAGSLQFKNYIIGVAQQQAAALGYDPNLVIGNLTVTWDPGMSVQQTFYY